MAQFEKEYLTRLVGRAGGNMSKAARLASIDRTTLYRLMDKHAFHRDESPGSRSDAGDRAARHHQRRAPARSRRARRRSGVWDPDGPSGGAIAPALWDALRDAVLWAQAEWERAVEHAAGMEEVTPHLAQLCTAIRQQASGADRRPGGAAPERALPPAARAHPRGLRRAGAGAARRPTPASCSGSSAPSSRWASGSRPTGRSTSPTGCPGPDGLELVVEVAHDLRSPLTSILFLAETLQRARSGPVNPVQERQLGLIYSAAFGLSSVASDVIELARGGDRLVDLDPIPFSVDRHPRVGARHRPADRRGEEPDGPAHDAGGGLPDRPSGGAEPRAAQPDHQRAQVHRRGLRRGRRAGDRPPRGRVLGARHRPRHPAAVHGHPVRAVPPPAEAGRVRLLRLGARASPSAASWSRRWAPILEVETAPGYGTRFYFVLDLPLAGEAQFG